jgi:large subunit ribosomal protein L31
MKQGIHPQYNEITVNCSCGESFKTRSTASKNLNLDVCSKCHPFYSGKQKLVDSEGRVDGFKKKFGSFAGLAKKK